MKFVSQEKLCVAFNQHGMLFITLKLTLYPEKLFNVTLCCFILIVEILS